MTHRSARIDWRAILALAAFVVACQPQLSAGILPPDQMTLSVANETSVDLVLVVNGRRIQSITATTRVDVPASDLPPLPWAAEVKLPTGRSLVETTVHAGDVWSTAVPNGGTQQHGVGARVDLSCGRIDLYSGAIPMGPAPGSGSPGDLRSIGHVTFANTERMDEWITPGRRRTSDGRCPN
jgi:hypothetical protein